MIDGLAASAGVFLTITSHDEHLFAGAPLAKKTLAPAMLEHSNNIHLNIHFDISDVEDSGKIIIARGDESREEFDAINGAFLSCKGEYIVHRDIASGSKVTSLQVHVRYSDPHYTANG